MDVKVVWSSLRVETWTSARRTTPGVITSARTRAATIAVAATPATVSTPPTGAPAPADRRRSTTTMGDSTRAGTPHVYRIGHLKTDRNAGEILRGDVAHRGPLCYNIRETVPPVPTITSSMSEISVGPTCGIRTGWIKKVSC